MSANEKEVIEARERESSAFFPRSERRLLLIKSGDWGIFIVFKTGELFVCTSKYRRVPMFVAANVMVGN